MGRPINKRYFGADANNNIKVQFHNGTSSVAGFIVKQKGSKTFVCSDGTTEAKCRLVDVASGSLAAGEMTITLKLDDTTVVRAQKITAHKFTDFSGNSYGWNFSTSTTDGRGQVEEAGTSTVAVSTSTGATNFEGDDQ